MTTVRIVTPAQRRAARGRRIGAVVAVVLAVATLAAAGYGYSWNTKVPPRDRGDAGAARAIATGRGAQAINGIVAMQTQCLADLDVLAEVAKRDDAEGKQAQNALRILEAAAASGRRDRR